MRQINTFTYPKVKHSGGRWFIEYRLNGQRKRKYYTIDKRPQFYGEQLARKVAKELEEANRAPGLYLFDLLPNILDEINARPATLKTYRFAVNVLLKYGQNVPLAEVNRAHISRALNKAAAARSWGASSKASYLRYIKAIFGAMINSGYITENPAKGIRVNAETSTRHVLLTAEEIETIKNWCLANCVDLWAVCQLVYYCGLRPAEVFKLLPQNLNSGVVYLSAASAKNKKAVTRTLPPNFKGLPVGLKHDYLYKIWRRMRTACKLRQGVTVYSFRHTAAVRLYRANKDIKQVQFFLRHSSVAITDTYLRNLGVIEETAAAGLPAI